MARPRKEGNSYFSFDVDFFSDKKIKILKARYGADGIAIYIYLLCEIYKSGYYLQMDEDFEFILSDDLNMNCDKVKQVMRFLLERSLFEKKLFQSDAVLTSTGIQKRYQLMVKSRALKNPVIVEKYWLLLPEDTEAFIRVNDQQYYSGNKVNYSKENHLEERNLFQKKKKQNKKESEDMSTYISKCFANQKLEDVFQLFIDSRKKKDILDEKQIGLLREELIGMSDHDEDRIAIVKKATISNWKSFYPIKEGRKKDTVNQFNNMEARKYNMESLEKELLQANRKEVEKKEKEAAYSSASPTISSKTRIRS